MVREGFYTRGSSYGGPRSLFYMGQALCVARIADCHHKVIYVIITEPAFEVGERGRRPGSGAPWPHPTLARAVAMVLILWGL